MHDDALDSASMVRCLHDSMIRWCWWWWWWWCDSWGRSNIINNIYIYRFSYDLMLSWIPTGGLLQGRHLSHSQNHKGCRRFYIVFLHKAVSQQPFHIDAFTHRRFYTQNVFPHRCLCTQEFLHWAIFTHRRFYTRMIVQFKTPAADAVCVKCSFRLDILRT